MLPSKSSPTMRPSAAMSGLPELPPTMSLFVERLNGVARSSVALRLLPARGNAERRLTRRALEQPVELRERLDGRAVLDPALHAAEVQPQRERRVGVDARAESCEPCARDVLVRGFDDGFDLVLVPLAQLARLGVERAREHDERVRRRVDRGLAAVPKLHADGGIGEAASRRRAAPRARRASPSRATAARWAHRGRATRACARARTTASAARARGRSARGRRAAAPSAARSRPCTRASARRSASAARRRRARACARSAPTGC